MTNNAHEVWEDLQNHFSQSHEPQIFQIERDIAWLAQDQMTVTTYYTKLKKVWDELGSSNNATCICGANNKRHKLMQFLMRLNDSYNTICGQHGQNIKGTGAATVPQKFVGFFFYIYLYIFKIYNYILFILSLYYGK